MATTTPPLVRGQLAELTHLAPGRPALLLGARIALATAVPLLLLPAIGPVAATWASTGAYSIAIVDKGGSYRMRAAMMGSATLGSTLAILCGGLASHHAAASIALMAAWSLVCAFAGVLGPAAASVGTTTAVLFAIGLAWPPSTPSVLLTRAIAVACSGAWAMLLALLFWPVRVYKPARFAVARVFRELAAHLQAWPARAHGVGDTGWIAATAQDHAAIRDAIETARAVLAETRRGRRGESGRGERLLILVSLADAVFSLVVQLAELFESAVNQGVPDAAREQLLQALATTVPALVELAAAIESESRAPRGPAPLMPSLDAREPLMQQAQLLLARLGNDVAMAQAHAATLYDDTRPAGEPVPLPDESRPLVELIRENLTPDSVFFRHATRVAATATAAEAVARWLNLPRGYWVTITVLILLQPYTPATVTKTLQRVVGTMFGAVVAALILGLVHDRLALTLIATLLATVSAAVLQLNYTLYAFFVTPTFVLLAEASARDPRLPELRIINTVIGGVLAFLGARLLWPHAERRRFPEELASALQALRAYLDAVTRAIATRTPLGDETLRAARRGFGLAINRADASFQRLLAESRARTRPLEPAMTALLFARRASATIGAAGSARQLLAMTNVADASAAASSTADAGHANALLAEAGAALDELAAAARERRPPAPLPDFAGAIADADPILTARFERLAEQLLALHQAVARWLALPRAVRRGRGPGRLTPRP